MISKRRLLKIHRWAGLLVALIVLSQAGTGILLVFRAQFAELVDPGGFTRSSVAHEATISQVIDAGRQRFPGFEIEHVSFPQTARGVYVAHLLNRAGASRWVSVDPGTSQILRAGSIWSFPADAALQIHYRLMTGRLGLGCIMLAGVALVILAICGLSFWWPQSGRFRRSLSIEPSAPMRLLLRRLHRNIGVFAAAGALYSSLTGLLVAGEFYLNPGPLTPLHSPATPLTGDLDAALAQARSVYPNRGIRDIRTSETGSFDVYFWALEMSPHAVHEVSIDPRTGRILSVTPAQSTHVIWMIVLPIHSGDTFGLPGSLFVLFGGLGLFGLAASGPIMWLQARRGVGR
jgi:uncharacterized iron-regulated membrane protein